MPAPCAVWGTPTHSSEKLPDAFRYFSPRAGGDYIITGSAKLMVDTMQDMEKAYLTTWMVDQRRGGNDLPEVTSSVLHRLRGMRPLNVAERRDRLLSVVAEHTPRLGQSMVYHQGYLDNVDGKRKTPTRWAEQYALMAASESLLLGEVVTLVNFAAGQGLIAYKSAHDITLTFDGYRHLEELNATGRDSSQGFVAMWFSTEMTTAYDKGFKLAIEDAGYKSMRIDQKEHANKIDDEIIAEIRRSRFLVSDFTCGMVGDGGTQTAIPRGGVYYEAGFAQGLGIPVIWCCREDHIGHVHFDTRQFNHITWNKPEELRKKLRNRIAAVLGDGPLGTK